MSAADAPWSREELEARLRRVGEERYHHRHPFNLRMHQGTLTPDEIRTWVRNRYYYQTRIPIKDGLILAKSSDANFRRDWVERIRDHDGRKPGEGGLELWLALAEAVGLDRSEVEGLGRILPGVRDACDDYVRFVESHDLLESVAASLTELFAGDIMVERIAAFEAHYPWVDTEGLRYFRSRTEQAPRDAAFGLDVVLGAARTRNDQERCVAALERKCEILWNLLDAIERGGARPRLSPHARLRTDDPSGGGVAVLSERAVKLNDAGREILELCNGDRTAGDVIAVLRERHPEEADLERDVHEFLGHMERLGVLTHA